jgi:hypothetical protein
VTLCELSTAGLRQRIAMEALRATAPKLDLV